MIDDLWASIHGLIEDVIATLPVARRGIVQSVDTSTMRVRVQIQPDPTGNSVSNWIPIASASMGNGWGFLAAPAIGAQVLVVPTDGHADSAVAIATHWSNVQLPPAGHNAGEFWLFHQSGSFIKLLNTGEIRAQDASGAMFDLPNNGTAVIQDKSGTALTFNNNGTATLSGTLIVTGDIYDLDKSKSSMSTIRDYYNEHIHTDTHGDTTTIPTPQVP